MLVSEQEQVQPEDVTTPAPDARSSPAESGPYLTREVLRKTVIIAVCVTAAAYYLPLVGVTMSLGFPYWDALGVPYYCLQPPHAFKPVLANLKYSVFADHIQYRPTSIFLFNVQYLLLGGEFWAWYLVRWAAFFGTAWLLYRSLCHVAGFAPAITAAAFFLFHQEPFVTDVMAADGYAAFFGALVLYYLARTSRRPEEFFDLSARTVPQCVVLLVVWTLASGAKEVMVPFLGALLLGFLPGLVRRRSAAAVLIWLGLCVPLGFAAYRIASLSHPSVGPSLFKEGLSQAVRDHFYWTARALAPHAVPHSPGHVLLYAGGAAMVVGLLASFLRPWRLLLLTVFGAALGGCALVILQTSPATKYLPVPVLLLTCILGAGLGASQEVLGRWLAPRARPWLAAAGVALWVGGCLFYATCTVCNTYSQYLGLMQTTDEMAEIVNFMEQRTPEGYACAFTGLLDTTKELPFEKGAHFALYFERFGREFYDRPQTTPFHIIAHHGRVPAGPFVLLTCLGPERLAGGELRQFGLEDLGRLEGVYQFDRCRYGSFERLVRRLKRLEAWMGNTHEAAITGPLPQPTRFGPNLPNPTHGLLWNATQAGPHLLYVFAAEPRGPRPTPVVVKKLEPYRRFGAYVR